MFCGMRPGGGGVNKSEVSQVLHILKSSGLRHEVRLGIEHSEQNQWTHVEQLEGEREREKFGMAGKWDIPSQSGQPPQKMKVLENSFFFFSTSTGAC